MITIPLTATLPATDVPVGIDPGHTACYAFTLDPDRSATFTVAQMGVRQDWTLRCWVSDSMAGNPIVYAPPHVVDFHASRGIGTALCVYDSAYLPPAVGRPLPAMPAAYYFCVQNLTNGVNHYSITLTETDLPDNTKVVSQSA